MSDTGEGTTGMAERDDRREGDAGQEKRPQHRTTAEWTTLAISTVVVLALVGAALAEIFRRDDPSGAVITVEVAVDRAEVRDGQTYIPYEIRNDGADAATDIVAIIEFTQGEQVVEETTVDIALLASHDVVEGEVVTTLDLDAHTVEARISTLQIP